MGFYFVNSDISNKRAHTHQMLSTAEFMDSVATVFPKYKGDRDISYYGLEKGVSIIFQNVFGLKGVSLLSFLLFDVSSSWFLIKQKFKHEVDFIYFRSSFFLLLSLTARILNVPLFYEIHRIPRSWSERIRDNFISKKAKGLIVISGRLKRHYLKRNQNIILAHDAVSFKKFALELGKNEAREKLGISQNIILGMYLGSISKLKGADIIFDAANDLPELDFYLVGLLNAELKNKKFSSNLFILPKVNQSEVALWQKAADFLIIPHPESEYSQSPMKLFEYMASGRPIISSDLENIREVLPDKGNLFFKPENRKDFILKVKKYLDNRSLYDKEAENNIKVAKKNTWEKRGYKITEFIKVQISKSK